MRFRELKTAEYGAQAPTGTTGTTPPGKVGQQMGKGPNAPKTNPTLQKKVQQANAQVTNKVLKPGQKLSIGGKEVAIDKVQGKEITIADPKNKMAPKTVLQKSDPTLAGAIQALVQPGAPK